MPEKTLNEQIAAAEAELAAASTFTERHLAGQKVDALNGAKLLDLIGRTDPATGAIQPKPVTPEDVRSTADGE